MLTEIDRGAKRHNLTDKVLVLGDFDSAKRTVVRLDTIVGYTYDEPPNSRGLRLTIYLSSGQSIGFETDAREDGEEHPLLWQVALDLDLVLTGRA